MACYKRIGLWLLIVVISAACSSLGKRRVESPVSSMRLLKNEIIKENIFATTAYQTLSIRRMNCSFSHDGEITDLRGSIRIRRDSVILISFSLNIGLEVARIQFTPDEVQAVLITQHEYIKENYSSLSQKIGIDLTYRMAERFFVGLLYTASDHLLADNYTMSVLDDGYLLQSRQGEKLLIDTHTLHPLSLSSDRQFTVKYEQLEEDRMNRFLPTLLKIDYQTSSLTLRYNRWEYDIPFKGSFKIPSSYTRL